MAFVLNLRQVTRGGSVRSEVEVLRDGVPTNAADFWSTLRQGNKRLLLAFHGFNVHQSDGINSLGHWGNAYEVPSDWEYVAVVWPGDAWLPIFVDYVIEGQEANKSGELLARFLNDAANVAPAMAFVSHSLGARVVLQTLRSLPKAQPGQPPISVVLMAGAVEADCFVREFDDVRQKINTLHIVASREDYVLKLAFPIGNPIGQIFMSGHPYFKEAIGAQGPSSRIPDVPSQALWQAPDGGSDKNWGYGHLDYLPSKEIPLKIYPPAEYPPRDHPEGDGWQPAWSAAVASTALADR